MYKNSLDLFLIMCSMVDMKLSREELSSAVLISTRSIYTSMTAFNLVLISGTTSKEVLETMDENISHYKKAIKFAESVMDQLPENFQLTIKSNIEMINEITNTNSMLISELYLND